MPPSHPSSSPRLALGFESLPSFESLAHQDGTMVRCHRRDQPQFLLIGSSVCSVLALCFGIARLGLAFHRKYQYLQLLGGLVGSLRKSSIPDTDAMSGTCHTVRSIPTLSYAIRFRAGKLLIAPQSIGIDQICYVIGILFAKLAVLILLFRIFGIDSRLRWVCFVLGPIIFLWSFISAVITIFRCRPIIAGWSLQYNWAHPHGSKCLDRIKLVTVFGWYNIISDFILILLPMPILWGMHLSWRKKIGVAVVFATGGV